MLRYTWKRLLRAPLAAIGCMLFAAALTAVLCGLHASAQRELQNYALVYDTIPVKLTVTNLMGTNIEDLHAPSWVVDVLTEPYYNLTQYVQEVCVKSSYHADKIKETDGEADLIGLSTAKGISALDPMLGAHVVWNEGYDESILRSDENVCLIPSGLPVEGETVTVVFLRESDTDSPGGFAQLEYHIKMKIVGTYAGGIDPDGMPTIYCSLETVRCAYAANAEKSVIDSVSAVLSNNHKLEEFRAALSEWFVEPNPTGKKTPWDKMNYEYYPYALDVDDTVLQQTTKVLENSMLVNRIAGVLILVLSTAAGFLIGFLTVRSRKREVALMRTMGMPGGGIYRCFAIEQLLCVLTGVLLGGGYFLWQPLDRPLILITTYLAGLTAALLIFLRRNLLTTIKEDE